MRDGDKHELARFMSDLNARQWVQVNTAAADAARQAFNEWWQAHGVVPLGVHAAAHAEGLTDRDRAKLKIMKIAAWK